jgi:ferredoxin
MTESDHTVGVWIDPELCAASGMCRRIAPTVFDLPDDADTAVVLQETVSDPELIRLAEQAESECPTQAIVLRRDA